MIGWLSVRSILNSLSARVHRPKSLGPLLTICGCFTVRQWNTLFRKCGGTSWRSSSHTLGESGILEGNMSSTKSDSFPASEESSLVLVNLILLTEGSLPLGLSCFFFKIRLVTLNFYNSCDFVKIHGNELNVICWIQFFSCDCFILQMTLNFWWRSMQKLYFWQNYVNYCVVNLLMLEVYSI